MASNVLFVVALFCALAGLATSQCPNIVSRSEWGARAPNSVTPMSNTPRYTIIHHSASAGCSSLSSCSSIIRGFQDQHMDVNGWSDIGYNFLVGGDGNVYQGRGWGVVGAHAPNYNSIGIGICAIGEFTNSAPSAAVQNVIQDLIACGVSQGEITSDYLLAGHRQVTATECPGNTFYSIIQGWPHWTANP